MKSLFGKIIAGAMGFAAVVSMTAFAATLTDVNVVTDKTEKSAIVTGTINDLDAANGQATILVVPAGKSLAEVADADIMHIDQTGVKDGNKFEFSFKLNPALIGETLVFDVYCGGTDVVAPYQGDRKIDLAEEDVKSFKLVGKVTVLEGADVEKVTAQIKNTANKVNAVADSEETPNVGTYTLTVNEVGSYTVVVGRDGYLYREISANTSTPNLPDTELLAGNVVAFAEGDSVDMVAMADLSALLNAYNKRVGTEGYNAAADIDDNGMVVMADLSALLNNYNKTAAAYNN